MVGSKVDGVVGSRVDGVVGSRVDGVVGSRVDGNMQTDSTVDSVTITSSNLSTSLVTYSLMGDNLDTTVKSRFIRTDGRKGSSLHYFHSLAIKDRISNLCELDITPYHNCINKPESTALEFLPSISNDKAMKDIFIMIISKILATHMPYFNLSCSDIVTWHKHHKYYKEMSTKSEVVRYCSILSMQYMHIS